MQNRAITILFFSLICILLLSGKAYSSCDIIKNGKTVATHLGTTFYRGGTELGTFDGIYVKKKGVIIGKYDGNFLKKKGVKVGSVDGDSVKGADGKVLYTVYRDGRVLKNGALYLKFKYYSGIFDIHYLAAVYLFFFDN